MFYSAETLANLANAYSEVPRKISELTEGFVLAKLENERAVEFARHGVSRRLQTIERCIEKTFSVLPPEYDQVGSIETVSDAVIYIQAFIFNVFGCLDNFAAIWVFEKSVTKRNGKPLLPWSVGFSKRCKEVRRSLSPVLQDHLKGLDKWYEHLERFRHALAHRVPLYIPPSVLDEKAEAKYRDLERQMAEALQEQRRNDYRTLFAEQRQLGSFRPWMVHSLTEKSPLVIVHPQLLSDVATLYELGVKFLEELNQKEKVR
jgi:hypothetical protein